MNTTSSQNRLATAAELEHAGQVLRSLGEESTARLVEQSAQSVCGLCQPLVVTDFATVDNEHSILLVPGGTHRVPRRILQQAQFILGLPSPDGLPTLYLDDGSKNLVTNADTGASSKLAVYDMVVSRFANVRLDAPQETVLETGFFDSHLFSDRLFQAECSLNVDVLNIAACSFLAGRTWALKAYGETSFTCRSTLERVLDGFHENSMKAVDAVFRPLVALGEKLDAHLGLK